MARETDLSAMTLDELHDYLMDFDGIPDELAMPSGNYPIAVVDASLEIGEKAPYLALTLKVTAGEYKDSQIWHNLSFSDKPFPRRRMKQAVLALLGKSPGKVTPPKLAKMLRGKAAVVATTQEEYEGEMRTRVRRFLPPGSEASTTKATAASKELDALFDEEEEEPKADDVQEERELDDDVPF